jgi:hypothetical protein
MNARTLALLVCFLVLPARTRADTAPVMPEELSARAALVVTGQVLSHREEDQERKDGSVIRTVILTVKVDAVEKGDAKPGDEIRASCWTVVRLPREGQLYDGGHFTIPGDGGRAKFYLGGGGGGHWSVIFPNGVERLDSTPPLEYRLEKAAPPAASDTVWYFFLGGAVLLLLTALGIFLVARRREPKHD